MLTRRLTSLSMSWLTVLLTAVLTLMMLAWLTWLPPRMLSPLPALCGSSLQAQDGQAPSLSRWDGDRREDASSTKWSFEQSKYRDRQRSSDRAAVNDGWRRTSTGWQYFPTVTSSSDTGDTIHVSAGLASVGHAPRHPGFFRDIWPLALALAEMLLLVWCLESRQPASELRT
jgi:hypothetical protein